MKLSKYRDSYYANSSKTSEICRQLSFAGLGVVWIFRLQVETGVKLPEYLVLPTLLFVIALSLDLLHAIASTATWGIFHRVKELNRKDSDTDPEVEAPRYLNWPIIFLFGGKIVAVIVGYYQLLRFLFNELV